MVRACTPSYVCGRPALDVSGDVTADWGTPFKLTKRQHELVSELVAGRSNRAIAERLQLSEQTVRNELVTLFHRLEVSSRLELVAKVRLVPHRDS